MVVGFGVPNLPDPYLHFEHFVKNLARPARGLRAGHVRTSNRARSWSAVGIARGVYWTTSCNVKGKVVTRSSTCFRGQQKNSREGIWPDPSVASVGIQIRYCFVQAARCSRKSDPRTTA